MVKSAQNAERKPVFVQQEIWDDKTQMCSHRLASRATKTLNPMFVFQTTMYFWKIYETGGKNCTFPWSMAAIGCRLFSNNVRFAACVLRNHGTQTITINLISQEIEKWSGSWFTAGRKSALWLCCQVVLVLLQCQDGFKSLSQRKTQPSLSISTLLWLMHFPKPL